TRAIRRARSDRFNAEDAEDAKTAVRLIRLRVPSRILCDEALSLLAAARPRYLVRSRPASRQIPIPTNNCRKTRPAKKLGRTPQTHSMTGPKSTSSVDCRV